VFGEAAMAITLTQHYEEELRKIDDELRSGPKIPPHPVRGRNGPGILDDLVAQVRWRAEEKRLQEEWPERREELLKRKRWLEEALRRSTAQRRSRDDEDDRVS
jgi:hypothetical protein